MPALRRTVIRTSRPERSSTAEGGLMREASTTCEVSGLVPLP
jgi:hypothetical protein